MTESTEVT